MQVGASILITADASIITAKPIFLAWKAGVETVRGGGGIDRFDFTAQPNAATILLHGCILCCADDGRSRLQDYLSGCTTVPRFLAVSTL